MTCLIDLNGTLISVLMQQIGSNPKIEISENLVRHMVLSTLLSYKQRFSDKYGELVLCVDSRENYWRKKIFPYYKANRKRDRDASGFNWVLIFEILNKIKEELKTVFPYKYVCISTAEADDVIAVLCEYMEAKSAPSGMFDDKSPTLIISSDKDLNQLLKFNNVDQWSPIKKVFIRVNDPIKTLQEHIMRGDKSDGVPNMFSSDKALVEPNGKQKALTQKRIKQAFEKGIASFGDEVIRNHKRNEMLIDFNYIPKELKDKIISVYESLKTTDRRKLFPYFVKHSLKNLMEQIGAF